MSALDPQKVTLTLKDETVDRIARRVVELLSEEGILSAQNGGLVSAAEVARALGVSRQHVYERASEFGAVKLGDGPKARMRFDLDAVRQRIETGKCHVPVAERVERSSARSGEL